MLGTIFFAVVAFNFIIGTFFFLSPKYSGKGLEIFKFCVVLLLIFAVVPFWLTVWCPAHKITFEETYQEYQEAHMLADYASSRDSWQIDNEEKAAIIAVINRYNKHAERLKKKHDNIWYGIYIDDNSTKLPTIGIPSKLQD